MIPEHKELRKQIYLFHFKQSISKKELNQAFQSFCDAYISYSIGVLGGKEFSEKQIIDYVFRKEFKTPNLFNGMVRRRLYVSQLYITELKNQVDGRNIHKYRELISTILVDLEFLQANINVHLKKSATNVPLNSWRCQFKRAVDLYSVGRTIWHFESFTSIKDIYTYDLRPVTAFVIRQIIEVFGRRIVGVMGITKNNAPVKKSSQIAWDFIKHELNKPSPLITLPFDINHVIKIEKWSNRYVHAAFDDDYYITWYALKFLQCFFIPAQTPIQDNQGNLITPRLDYSEVIISNYTDLKVSFENYIDPNGNENYTIDWLEAKNLNAYVLNE